MLFRTTFLKNCDGVSVPLSHSHDLCFFQSSERLDQSFDSLLFIDIFIVLDFILDQLIDHLHAKQLHRRLVICEDIISFLILCKI